MKLDYLKRISIETAGYMSLIDSEKHRAFRQLNCANNIHYAVAGENLEMFLNKACFCYLRTCAICWRIKSSKIRNKVFHGVERMLLEYPNLQAIFLTLTVKNCHQSELRNQINQLQKAWNSFKRASDFPAIGYLKTIEVTRPSDCYYAGIYVGRYGTKMIKKIKNLITDFDNKLWYEYFTEEVHPHIHALLIVEHSYFANMIDHLGWVARWKLAAKLDYKPVVDVRRVYSESEKGLTNAIFEVSKYALKPSDMRGLSGVFILRQLHGLKLFSVGGILKQYIKEATINKIDTTGKSGEEFHQEGFPLEYHWSTTNEEYQITKLADMEWELA